MNIEVGIVRKIVKYGERLGLAGLLAVIAYVVVGMLLSLVTVNGQPDSGNDVVVHMGEFGVESLRAEILPLDGV